jgi:pseudouridine-5'-phosphate glycosidase
MQAKPNPHLDLHPDVAAALQRGAPVVALESTIISHGMPWPQNVETALRVQAEVRAPRRRAGHHRGDRRAAEGRPDAGADRGPWPPVRPCPRSAGATWAFMVAEGGTGATTVATTMIVAAMAGIRVFATGGIGGVHRGAEQSFDISADLQELARTRWPWCVPVPRRSWTCA